MGKARYRLHFVLLALSAHAWHAVQTPARAADATYSDSTFPAANWTLITRTAGAGGEIVVSQESGGNPGAHRRVQHRMKGKTGAANTQVLGFHGLQNASYDPQRQGSIASVDFSVDAINVDAPGLDGHTMGPALRQKGEIYVAAFRLNTAQTAWTTKTVTGLKQNDFYRVDPAHANFIVFAENPDFSSKGSPLEIGYFAWTTQPEPFDRVTTAGYDNFLFKIKSAVRVTSADLNQLDTVVNPKDPWSVLAWAAVGSTTGAGALASCLMALQATQANGPAKDSDPVVTATGEFIHTTLDLYLGGPLPLGFGRYYGASLASAAQNAGFDALADGPVGKNWTHNFLILLRKADANNVEVYYYKGKIIRFQKSGSNWSFQAGSGYKGTPYQLLESGTKLRLLDTQNGRILGFDIAGLTDGGVRGVETIQDRNGNTQTLTYSPEGVLSKVEDGLGRTLEFSYSATGGKAKLTKLTDQSGRFIQFGHQVAELRTYTDPRGKVTTYTTGAGSLLETITRPAGNAPVRNTYDSALGIVTAQADGSGNTTRFSYSSGPFATTITDPLGNARKHQFNAQLLLERYTDETGKSLVFGYDEFHRRISTADRMGDTSRITYDSATGKITSRTDNTDKAWRYTYTTQTQDGFSFDNVTRIDYPDGTRDEFGYDAKGNLLSRRDRAGVTWSYTYNSRGQILTATNPEGGVATYTYNADATLASFRDPGGNTTAYAYDALKRLERITRPDQTTVRYTYDAGGNLLTRTNEKGKTTTFTYDDNNNLKTVTNPLGKTWSFSYDANDRLTAVTDPLGKNTLVTYDASGRVKTVTDRNGNTTTRHYDARGRLVSAVDAAGQTRSMTYDDEGVMTSFTNPLGQIWKFTSDKQGRITALADPLANETRFTYDPFSRPVSRTNPRGETRAFAYDERGLMRQVTEPESVSAGYTRNGLGRITRITNARNKSRVYAYDASGRLALSTDVLGNATAFQYDARNRPHRIDLPMSQVDISYDETGLPAKLEFSDGTALTYGYDDANRLTAASGVSLGYDDANRLLSTNGIAIARDTGGRITAMTLEAGKTITYQYDKRNLLTAVTDWLGGTTRFEYDSARRLTSMTRPNGVITTYTYDKAGRLSATAETKGQTNYASISLTRDGGGQIKEANRDLPLLPAPIQGKRDYTYNDADQIAQFKYDKLGRLTDDGARNYAWDLASRLRSYREGASAVEFTYDAFGHRLTRTQEGKTRSQVWNYAMGLSSVSIVKDEGAVTRYYVHTPGGSLLYSIEAANNQRRFYHYDEIGSTIFLTDDAGVITDAYAYTAYGRLTASAGSSDNPFTYVGRFGVMREPGTSLYYMRARYYDSASWRFLSRDPRGVNLVDPKSTNLYQYAAQNPGRYVDPRGRQEVVVEDPQVLFWDPGIALLTRLFVGFPENEIPDSEAYFDLLLPGIARSSGNVISQEPMESVIEQLERDPEEEHGIILVGVGGGSLNPEEEKRLRRHLTTDGGCRDLDPVSFRGQDVVIFNPSVTLALQGPQGLQSYLFFVLEEAELELIRSVIGPSFRPNDPPEQVDEDESIIPFLTEYLVIAAVDSPRSGTGREGKRGPSQPLEREDSCIA